MTVSEFAPRFEIIEGGKAKQPRALEAITFDLEAEGALLSTVIMDPVSLAEVRSWLKPEHFYSEAHQIIYRAVCELGEPLDVVILGSHLRQTSLLERVGGIAYLTDLINVAPVLSPTHLKLYAKTVRDLFVRRSLRFLGVEVQKRADLDPCGVAQLMNDTQVTLEVLRETLNQSEASSRVSAITDRVVGELMQASQQKTVMATGTGFTRLDHLIGGLPKDLSLLAAEPGMGKTALACGIATNIAYRGAGALIFSLETTELPIMTRILSAESHVDAKRAMRSDLRPEEWSRIMAAAKDLAGLPMWIPTKSHLETKDIWNKARLTQLQLAREGKALELVVVDYLQLVRHRRGPVKRNEQVAQVTRDLKAIATELGCAVLALSQLSRAPAQRDDHRPRLSDLAESSELEKCARLVMLLYRQDHYRKDDEQTDSIAEVRVAKQNNGPRGLVRLRFDAPSTRFDNLAEGEWE